MSGRPVIDATQLAQHAFGPRAPVWWGNMLMLVIESMSMTILAVSYFYIRQNFHQWPPPSPHLPLVFHNPELLFSSINIALLLASFPLATWIDFAAKRGQARGVRLGLVILLLIGFVSLGLRVFEFRGLHLRWDENAYGSVVWGTLAMHFIYILGSLGEVASITLWVFLHEWDMKHAVDVTLTAIYWNWMVVVGLLVYLLIFWVPRLL